MLIFFFQISAPNIEFGYPLEPHQRSGSNEYPQSMYLSRNKKNNIYLCKPPVLLHKSGVSGVSKLYRHVFVMWRQFVHSFFHEKIKKKYTGIVQDKYSVNLF